MNLTEIGQLFRTWRRHTKCKTDIECLGLTKLDGENRGQENKRLVLRLGNYIRIVPGAKMGRRQVSRNNKILQEI